MEVNITINILQSSIKLYFFITNFEIYKKKQKQTQNIQTFMHVFYNSCKI